MTVGGNRRKIRDLSPFTQTDYLRSPKIASIFLAYAQECPRLFRNERLNAVELDTYSSFAENCQYEKRSTARRNLLA